MNVSPEVLSLSPLSVSLSLLHGKPLEFHLSRIGAFPLFSYLYRCFGLLISPGREVPDREMHLLDVVSLP